MPQATGETSLKKQIGFTGLLAMCVGLNIGGSLFVLTTVAAGLAGPSLPIAMLISAMPAMLAIVPYGVLSSAVPITSATYRYSQMIHPWVALVNSLTLAVCIMIGGQPLFAKAFGIYLQKIVPVDPMAGGFCVLTFFYAINIVGVDLTAKIQVLLFILLMGALLLFVVLGVSHVDIVHFQDLFPKGVGGTVAAAGLLFTFCAGGFFVIDLGGEVIQGHRVLPKALFWGMLIAVVFYVIILFVCVGVMDAMALKGLTLIDIAQKFMPDPMLNFFIVGGALVACATTINIIFTIVARGLMVISIEGLLPKVLGNVSTRFGTPHWGLTLAYLISVVSFFSISSLMLYGAMLNLSLILSISLVAISGVIFLKRFPEMGNRSALRWSYRKVKFVSISVVVLNSMIFLFFVMAIGKSAILFLFILVCMSGYAFRRRKALKTIRFDPHFSSSENTKISFKREDYESRKEGSV